MRTSFGVCIVNSKFDPSSTTDITVFYAILNPVITGFCPLLMLYGNVLVAVVYRLRCFISHIMMVTAAIRNISYVFCFGVCDVICIFSPTLQWRRNERDGVSNHQRLDYSLNRLFRRRSMKTSKLRVTDLYEGNPPVTTSVSSIYLTVCSGADQRKHQSSTPLEGYPPVTGGSPHKGPMTKKCFHLMTSSCFRTSLLCILLHACRFTWLFSTAVRAAFYLWSGNISANERRGWICNV